MKTVRLLITDMDNTLYDWVTYFSRSFRAMLTELVPILGVEEATLLDEFKTIHQWYGNSEQPFAVLELPSVRKRFGDLPRDLLKQKLDPCFHAFNSARKKYLRLYPGVADTIRELERQGVMIVAHTEALAVNAIFRLETLGIRESFSRVYAIEGRMLPHPDRNRHPSLDAPSDDFVTIIPKDERKPNPRLLLDICKRHGVLPTEAVYVGDSLTRDILMALNAGVAAVWARYGLDYERALWDILVRVSHWSDADVQREAELRRDASSIQADYTIDSFNEIVSLDGLRWQQVGSDDGASEGDKIIHAVKNHLSLCSVG